MLQLELSCVETGKSDEPFQNSEKSDFFSNWCWWRRLQSFKLPVEESWLEKWWRKSFRGYNLFFLLCPENLDRFGENLNLIHQKTKRQAFSRKRSSSGTDQNVFSQTKFGLNRLRRHLMNWSNWIGKASGYAIQNYADLKLIVLTWCVFHLIGVVLEGELSDVYAELYSAVKQAF